MSESDLLTGVLDLCRVLGWRVAHFRPARTARGWRHPVSADGAGFPTCYSCGRGGRIVAAELKAERGRVATEQMHWLADLTAAGVPAFVWRPSDYPDGIAEVLR